MSKCSKGAEDKALSLWAKGMMDQSYNAMQHTVYLLASLPDSPEKQHTYEDIFITAIHLARTL